MAEIARCDDERVPCGICGAPRMWFRPALAGGVIPKGWTMTCDCRFRPNLPRFATQQDAIAAWNPSGSGEGCCP